MNWMLAAPELLLAGGAVALLMIGVFMSEDRLRAISWLSVLVLVAAMFWKTLTGR